MQRPPSLPADDPADRGRHMAVEPEHAPPTAGNAAAAPPPDPEVEREAFARRHVMSEALIALLARLAG
jgi:hypothetical protein